MIRWQEYSLSHQQSSHYIMIMFVPPAKTSSSCHWSYNNENELQLIKSVPSQQIKFAIFKVFSLGFCNDLFSLGADNKNAKRFPLPRLTPLTLHCQNFSKYTIIWSKVELQEYILKLETQIVTRLNVIKLFLTWSVLCKSRQRIYSQKHFSHLHLLIFTPFFELSNFEEGFMLQQELCKVVFK